MQLITNYWACIILPSRLIITNLQAKLFILYTQDYYFIGPIIQAILTQIIISYAAYYLFSQAS